MVNASSCFLLNCGQARISVSGDSFKAKCKFIPHQWPQRNSLQEWRDYIKASI